MALPLSLPTPIFYLLDLDGTLVRFSWLDPRLQAERQRLHELAQQLKVPPPPGMLFPALLALGRERPDVLQALEAIELRAAMQSTVCPGALELLTALRGEPTAIVTNNGRAAVQAALGAVAAQGPAGALGLVDGELPLICRDDVERPKPDPQPFQLALERLRARFGEPASVLVVGDSLADVKAALALQATLQARPERATPAVIAIGVEGGVGKAADLASSGAAHVVPDLHALRALCGLHAHLTRPPQRPA
jgi:phosphoglycolate phosphatase-like HAD superfamily hydrolase